MLANPKGSEEEDYQLINTPVTTAIGSHKFASDKEVGMSKKATNNVVSSFVQGLSVVRLVPLVTPF
jgi:hypothetical protein